MSDERSEGFQGEGGDSVSGNLLHSFDRVIASLPPGDPMRRELLALRPQIADQQETMIEARQMIEKLEEVVKKVTSPANRIGTFSAPPRARRRTSWSAARIIIATSIRAFHLREVEKGHARAGQRSVCHRRRSRLRNGGPGDKNHRSPRHGPAARRHRARHAIDRPAALCRSGEIS